MPIVLCVYNNNNAQLSLVPFFYYCFIRCSLKKKKRDEREKIIDGHNRTGTVTSCSSIHHSVVLLLVLLLPLLIRVWPERALAASPNSRPKGKREGRESGCNCGTFFSSSSLFVFSLTAVCRETGEWEAKFTVPRRGKTCTVRCGTLLSPRCCQCLTHRWVVCIGVCVCGCWCNCVCVWLMQTSCTHSHSRRPDAGQSETKDARQKGLCASLPPLPPPFCIYFTEQGVSYQTASIIFSLFVCLFVSQFVALTHSFFFRYHGEEAGWLVCSPS